MVCVLAEDCAMVLSCVPCVMVLIAHVMMLAGLEDTDSLSGVPVFDPEDTNPANPDFIHAIVVDLSGSALPDSWAQICFICA